MAKLIIDNITVEVAEGVTVLEAAQSAGIAIPHFCYHPALGKAGACRVCAVKMVDGPVKGIQMSCMLPAQDGMVVSTTDPEALAMRRQVIEWLMINHPHDCPVCDEGGECQLQDFTIAGGHGRRRYTGKKRTHVNQFLGPYIEHEMNRCIQCYRCVRFYQEFAGGSDFGVMGSAGRIYYGRAEDGQLESPFSGNLVDICPTGVFTDKTARFKARYWDYDLAPSVCPHCSLGCNTVPAARYRELLKTMARRNDAVNGWFLCDRGRFEKQGVNAPLRPRQPQVDSKKVGWDEALTVLCQRLRESGTTQGPETLAIVGSPRLAMEAASLLHSLAAVTGAGSLCYFAMEREAGQTAMAAARLNDATAASMADVQAADMIGIVNCRVLEEGPMMALAVRQAWRRGAKVFLVENDGVEQKPKGLPFAWQPVPSLSAIPFGEAENPVLICGDENEGLADLGQSLAQGLKLACLLNGPNALGAALLARQHGGTSLAGAVAAGKVKGIIAVEADIPAELLQGIAVVATLDWRDTETVRAAGIVLPTTAWVEMDGTYINNEGRAQRFKKVMTAGLPITGLDPAGHPPRRHQALVPGGEPRPAWEVMATLIERLGTAGAVLPLAGPWQWLRDLDAEGGGQRIWPNTPDREVR
jgi:NADH-quinone oxidoreductase subunit G